MKRILSLLLVAVLALSMAACGNNNTTPTTEATNAPTTEATQAPTTEATEAPTTEATEPSSDELTGTSLYMLTIMYGESYDNCTNISIYNDDMGGCYIDFNGDVRKVATLDLSVLADIEAKLNETGLLDLNGTAEYGDKGTVAYLSAVYTDWSSANVDYAGAEVPAETDAAFQTLVAYIETLMADVEEYVPQAAVYGYVDETLLAELQAIVNNSGIDGLDTMAIQGIALDDTFSYSAGLSTSDGISAGASCAPLMMTTAYSLVIVNVEDPANTASVASDFEASMNWRKWVCVAPSQAVIAQKGNMVLCLMASDSMYAGTLAAINGNGWTVVSELNNPDF